MSTVQFNIHVSNLIQSISKRPVVTFFCNNYSNSIIKIVQSIQTLSNECLTILQIPFITQSTALDTDSHEIGPRLLLLTYLIIIFILSRNKLSVKTTQIGTNLFYITHLNHDNVAFISVQKWNYFWH
jgi:hypothetical protein